MLVVSNSTEYSRGTIERITYVGPQLSSVLRDVADEVEKLECSEHGEDDDEYNTVWDITVEQDDTDKAWIVVLYHD